VGIAGGPDVALVQPAAAMAADEHPVAGDGKGERLVVEGGAPLLVLEGRARILPASGAGLAAG